MNPYVRQELAERFRHFALYECLDSSPLYAIFALTVADDDALLDLASHCRVGQPPANLLFAAIQDILLRGEEHALRGFYPALTRSPRPCEEAGEPFKDFCAKHESEIKSLIAVRLVQTNEVRRCVPIQAAFAYVMKTMGDRPLSLIEIGPSAGFNLCWDRYSYGPMAWESNSEVRLESEWRGPKRPPRWEKQPVVTYRAGVDLNVIDLEEEEARRWLLALIWPEHEERRNRLRHVIEITRQSKLELREGDAVEELLSMSGAAPENSLLCVYHTWVANQMTGKQQAKLLDVIERIGRSRDLCHIYNNIEPHLHLTYYLDGTRHDIPLATTDGHARWVEWLA